jgi:hypothetical protein
MHAHSLLAARYVRLAGIAALTILPTLLAACGKGTGGY